MNTYPDQFTAWRPDGAPMKLDSRDLSTVNRYANGRPWRQARKDAVEAVTRPAIVRMLASAWL